MALTVSPARLLRGGVAALLVRANQRGPAWVLQPAWRHIADAIALESGAFLDVGCGAGWLALYVASGKPELDAVGIDTDRLALGIGERNKGTRLNVTLREMDTARIVYPDRTFHAAAAVSASQRWADPEATLAEVHRVLRPGGRFYVYEGDAELAELPPGWLRSPGPWVPQSALLAAFRQRGVDPQAWERLKEAVRRSPFRGGEDGRHGPYRRLILTRTAP